MPILILGSILSAAKEAWHYVTSAVQSSIPVGQAQSVISTISDVLSDKEFDDMYGLYEKSVEDWQRILNVPEEYTVSSNFALQTPFDYRQKHIMQMKILATDVATGKQIEQWITVESDKVLSRGKWLDNAQDAVANSPFGYNYSIDYVSEYEYYVKEK